MFDIDELTKKLSSLLPDNMLAVEKDLQDKFKGILQATFARLDLVTREEFDVQTKVLERTREKLEILEERVQSLLPQQQSEKPN